MLRSMYAGISGMKGFQTKLDVIGNNIANVNTSGFKKGRATFQDMLSQTTRGAQAPTGTRGGINPMQVGLGSQVGTIDNIHTQGFVQTTGSTLDMAIEGNGMFVVQEGDSTYYTRAGNFYLDNNGTIVNPDGYTLMGYAVNQFPVIINEDVMFVLNDQGIPDSVRTIDGQDLYLVNNGDGSYSASNDEDGTDITSTIVVDQTGQVSYRLNDAEGEEVSPDLLTETTNNLGTLTLPSDAQSFSISDDGMINYVDASGAPRVAGRVALANFSNPEGLEKVGNNLFFNSPNAGLTGITVPGEQGMGKVISSALEMSNVDLAEEFTEMIVAQRGFQANTRIITTSDEILQELVNLKR